MTRPYRRAALLVIASTVSLAPSAASADSFTNSYGLDVGVEQGRCVFFLTDMGMSAVEVTMKLKEDGYDTSRGLEVLLTKSTPGKCGELGREAALKAGFKQVRVRLATDKNRWQRP